MNNLSGELAEMDERGVAGNLLLKEARERTCTHRWTLEESDGIAKCTACGEERGQLVAPSHGGTHASKSNGPLKPTQTNCQHLFAAADEEDISVCSMCGFEERREANDEAERKR